MESSRPQPTVSIAYKRLHGEQHVGVQGMREQAAQIGGWPDIDDVEAGGTRVTLPAPGKLAYIAQEKALKAG